MELIFVLLPFALLFAGIALALFVWAARSGQFDDLDTPAVRILFDDETAPPARSAGEADDVTPSPARGADEPDKEEP
jgi:cbb3-type cytochrome oxidase maturation protein